MADQAFLSGRSTVTPSASTAARGFLASGLPELALALRGVARSALDDVALTLAQPLPGVGSDQQHIGHRGVLIERVVARDFEVMREMKARWVVLGAIDDSLLKGRVELSP